MSVRKRTWITRKGEEKEAWVADYRDQEGRRLLKTFARMKDATAFAATANVEVRDGTHVADSASVTVMEAGEKWLKMLEPIRRPSPTKNWNRPRSINTGSIFGCTSSQSSGA